MTRPVAVEPERRLLGYKRAAAYLGISERSMRTLAAEGVFVKVPINGRVLFDRVDLDAYVDDAKARA